MACRQLNYSSREMHIQLQLLLSEGAIQIVDTRTNAVVFRQQIGGFQLVD